jgi:hypothetical protein
MLTFSELNLQPELDLEKTNTRFASSELESLGIFNAKNSEEEEVNKNNELESLGIFDSQQNSISTPEIITPPEEVINNNILKNNEVTELPIRPQKLIDLDKYISSNFDTPDLTKEEILADENLMEIVYQSLEARFHGGSGFVNALTAKGKGTLGGSTGRRAFRNSTNYRDMKPEQAFEIWQNHQRSVLSAQSVTLGNELAFIAMADADTRGRIGAGHVLMDKMTNAITGRGTLPEMADAIVDYTVNTIWDPVTLLSFGIGKIIQKAGAKAGMTAFSRAMGTAYQELLKKGVAKEQAKKKVKEIFSEEVFNRSFGKFVANTTVSQTVPAVFLNVGTDVVYQNHMMDLDVQDGYSGLQTSLAAVTSMTIPALVQGTKLLKDFRAKFPDSWFGYKKLDDAFVEGGLKALEEQNKNIVNQVSMKGLVLQNFENVFQGKTRITKSQAAEKFMSWTDTKATSLKIKKANGDDFTDNEIANQFLNFFWFGSKDNTLTPNGGYYKALKDAGFYLHASQADGKGGVTNAFSQMIEWIPQKDLNLMIKNFEKAIGYEGSMDKALKLTSVTKVTGKGSVQTPKRLAALFVNQASEGGKALQVSSRLSKSEFSPEFTKDITGLFMKSDVEPTPEYGRFTLSLYKRLLVSSLSTTGTNVKGFAQLVSLNSLSDMATGAIETVQYRAYKHLLKDPDKAAKFLNKRFGSFRGGARRAISVFSPEAEYEFAEAILKLNPKAREQLFRYIGGLRGETNPLEDFNIKGGVSKKENIAWEKKKSKLIEARDKEKANSMLSKQKLVTKPGSKNALEKIEKELAEHIAKEPKRVGVRIAEGADAVTKGIQALSFIRTQDQVTKTWAFGGHVNQFIMKEYGVSPGKFFSRTDIKKEMLSPKFQEGVIEKALMRTQRETASVNWTNKSREQADNIFLAAAVEIERISNGRVLGYYVPFGSFANTVLATAGDLTGLNAIRRTFRYGYGQVTGDKTRIKGGKEVPFINEVDGSTAELWGKAIVGYTTLYGLTYGSDALGLKGSVQKIKEGEAHNQRLLSTGRIADEKYDWPLSTLNVASQIMGHLVIANGQDKPLTDLQLNIGNLEKVKDKLVAGLPLPGIWGEVPRGLLLELVDQLGGSNVRNLTQGTTRYYQGILKALESGDFSVLPQKQEADGKPYSKGALWEGIPATVRAVAQPPIGRLVLGGTRFIEPYNAVLGYIRNNEMYPDLGGTNKATYGLFKYINNLLPSNQEDAVSGVWKDLQVRKESAVTSKNFDAGKLIFGARSSQANSVYMQMLNSSGTPEWLGGGELPRELLSAPPEFRNKINEMLRLFLNIEAQNVLDKLAEREINFWELPRSGTNIDVNNKERVMSDLNKNAAKKLKEMLMSDTDMRYSAIIQLSGENKKNVKDAIQINFSTYESGFKPQTLDDVVNPPKNKNGNDLWDVDDELENILNIVKFKPETIID